MTSLSYNRNFQFILFTGLFIISLAAAIWFDLYFFVAIPFVLLFFYFGWQNRNAVFFLLLLTLPLSTEFRLTDTLGTDLPDEPLMLFTTGLFLCFALYSTKSLNGKLVGHPLVLFLLITVTWSAITAIFSTYPIISIKFLLAKSWYIGAFVLAPLIVFRNKRNIKIGVLLLSLAMLSVALITLVRHYKYDFTFAMINDVLNPFFRNHVNYSAMLVCMIPVFFAIFSLNSSWVIRTITVLAITVLLIALFLSYSRGAWLALVVGAIAYWLIKRRLMVAAFMAAVVVVASSLFWLQSNDRYLQYAHDYRTTIFHENFQEHLTATYNLKDLSTAERFNRWIAGVRMIKDNEVLGYGPATFYSNYRPYTIPAFKTWVSDNKEHSTVHNYFLMITVEQGIPGLLFFLLLIGAMFYYAQRLYHRVKDPLYKVVAITSGIVLAMIITVNFLSDLIETDKVGSLFFLCLAILIVTDVNTRKESNSSPDIQRIS